MQYPVIPQKKGLLRESTGMPIPKGLIIVPPASTFNFRSDVKFSSSSGWSSFFEQANHNSIVYKVDNSFGMERIEALCGRCKSHMVQFV